MKRTALYLLIGVALAACSKTEPTASQSAAAASGAGKPDATQAAVAAPAVQPGEKIILNVELLQAETRDITINLQASGTVSAWQEAQIGPEVGGLRITQVKAQVGDRVRKGDVVATLNRDMVEADLEQAEATVKDTTAAWETARIEAQRVQQLGNTGAFSAQQVSQIMNHEKSAEARMLSAKAQLKQQQLRLRKTDITAPDDGTVSASMATVGSVVQPGQELFRLIRQNRLEWRAEVTADELNRIKLGQSVRLQPDQSDAFDGKVRVVAPTVDRSTRNALVYVDLPDGLSRGLRAGQYLRGQFIIGQRKAMVIPQEAAVLRDGFTYVFTAQPSGDSDAAKLTMTKVETGQRSGNLVEIKSGLKGDESLVASGASFLNDGDVVRVVKK